MFSICALAGRSTEHISSFALDVTTPLGVFTEIPSLHVHCLGEGTFVLPVRINLCQIASSVLSLMDTCMWSLWVSLG